MLPSAFSSADCAGAPIMRAPPAIASALRALPKSRISPSVSALPVNFGEAAASRQQNLLPLPGKGVRAKAFGLKLVLLHHHRLVARGGDPFLYFRHRHDRAAIGFGFALELDLVGAETAHDRRVHCVGDREVAEQEIAAALAAADTAIAPDRHDAVDVALHF